MHGVIELVEKVLVIFLSLFSCETQRVDFLNARLRTRLRRGKQTFFNSS